MYKKMNEKQYVTHQQTITTELRAPDLRQTHCTHIQIERG